MDAKRQWMQGDAGASAVEFALVLLPLLLIIFGIIDYGRAFYVQVNLESATREIARQWAVDGSAAAIDDEKAHVDALVALSSLSASGAAPTWTFTPSTCTAVGQALKTDVSIPFAMAFPLLPGPSTLQAATTMRCERIA